MSDFADFWQINRRKVSRVTAERAWKRVPRAQRAQVIEAYRQAWQQHDDSGKPFEFFPHASTWLNQRRWEEVRLEKPVIRLEKHCECGEPVAVANLCGLCYSKKYSTTGPTSYAALRDQWRNETDRDGAAEKARRLYAKVLARTGRVMETEQEYVPGADG